VNGAHDLGGKHGFGKIDRSQDCNFAADWEERVFALTLASGMLGQWNLDQSRSAREQMDPGHYLNSSYYEHWLSGLEQLLLEKNLLTEEELNTGLPQSDQSRSFVKSADPDKMRQLLDVGGPTLLESTREPEFRIGDQVVVVADHPRSHTRAPGYVKGKIGVVAAHHGAHVFADTHALTGEKVGEHLYGVKFDAVTLWGSDKSGIPGKEVVFVDLFEPYLQSLEDHKNKLGA